MPDLGPLGRGGARRRTRRRMTAMEQMKDSQSETQPQKPEEISGDKVVKLAKLLKDKGVITESEYNMIFE